MQWSENTRKQLDVFLYNVAYLPAKHGLSKKEMAHICGIGIRSLNLIEAGMLPPNIGIKIFFRIQRYFGISPSQQLDKRLG